MSIELAQRAVACKHWRWMPGMRDLHYGRVIDVHVDEIVFRDCRVAAFAKAQPDQPDLDDPATLGCLLALVREAWGDDGITTSCTRCGGGTGWSVHRSSPVNGVSALVLVLSETEATVLICALEAAP